MTQRTCITFGTEATKIVDTWFHFYVAVVTTLAMAAESACVPWAVTHLVFRPDVTEDTVLVATLAILGEKETLWHLRWVILMQVFAVVAFLTERLHPVLAHHGLFASMSLHRRWI